MSNKKKNPKKKESEKEWKPDMSQIKVVKREASETSWQADDSQIRGVMYKKRIVIDSEEGKNRDE
jgi:hypothetical protein